MSAVAALKKMMRFGHHEAVAVTVEESGSPHAAAMGVRLVGDDLILHPYVTTKTFRNIQRGSLVSLALTHNALVFCDVVMNSSKLRFKHGRSSSVYILDGDVDFYIEAVPKGIEVRNQIASVSMRVMDLYEGSSDYFPYSRANSMLIEALIYFTKIRALGIDSSLRDVSISEWLRTLEYAASIARKLGSGELIECVERIYEELENMGMYR
ncbi:MAG: DUF447 family protein [Sulfolobales archaeon]|nr:DUF447 family protein [Sulfolobales archaeon]MDW8083404.1 DUF447 family protein [Sulfolobales archaeon]